jgi:membrane protease YdiL (CAAX protease family)
LIFAILVKSGKCGYSRICAAVSRENVILTAPVIMPTVAIVFLVSFLTAFLLGKFFEAPAVDVSGNLFGVIILHALVPAVFEEALFRYIPIAMLSHISKRDCIWISALLFALVHCNLFQIPYAFVAGIVLVSVDIAFNSLIPSVLIHFLNNLFSILFMRYGNSERFVLWFVISLAVLSAASVAFIILKKEKYVEKFKPLFEKGKEKITLTADIFVLIVLTLIISVTNLLY